jgi:predicted nucleic acid-binding protein
MILVDSTDLIDYIRTKDKKLLAAMKAQGGDVCGIVRAEILHGARDARHRSRLLAGLNALLQISIPEAIWDLVGDNLAALRAAGVTVPFTDAALTTLAMSLDIELWGRDKHFPAIQKVLSRLKLFQGPP